MKKISLRATAVAVAALAAGQAWATNGMLMEGYGPIALSMGGAALAYDNGTAGMMNNVATLQLGENGTRADVALGLLGPNVSSSMTGMPTAKSGGTSYVMPAVGWIRKNDQLSYGVGIFGQGGMGTEYDASSFLGADGKGTRSELGVGRLIFPVSYKVNDQLNVGASLDYSWAGMDMMMAADGTTLGGMVTGGSGPIAAAAPGFVAASWARIDFSNGNDFTGAAKSGGWTGKLGLTYKISPQLTLGISHHLKTGLADMKTGANAASMSASIGFADSGQIIIHDFQMPASTTVGFALQATPKLMLAVDVKSIAWADVMKQLSMTYVSAGMGGSLDFALPQNWKDQTVVSVGGAYKYSDGLTLRAGYSHASNPIPDAYVLPIFPATIEDHFTAGFGYQISKNTSLDAAVSHAPKVTIVNGSGISISHSQTNYQLMLSYRY